MPLKVCMGATLTCSFGAAPSQLVVLPINRSMSNGKPYANILDTVPFVNIVPFAMCNSMANPVVSAATAAALGIPTPMPCNPATLGAWYPGATDSFEDNTPAVHMACKCRCMWGGEISIVDAGQIEESVE